jgi:hypothetical protein
VRWPAGRRYPLAMEIDLRQRGGVLGIDRRYVVKDGTIETIEKGRSRGLRELDPQRAARIDQLASFASDAPVEAVDLPRSDDMETTLDIRQNSGSRSIRLHSGYTAPREVWDLIGEVSRASRG